MATTYYNQYPSYNRNIILTTPLPRPGWAGDSQESPPTNRIYRHDSLTCKSESVISRDRTGIVLFRWQQRTQVTRSVAASFLYYCGNTIGRLLYQKPLTTRVYCPSSTPHRKDIQDTEFQLLSPGYGTFCESNAQQTNKILLLCLVFLRCRSFLITYVYLCNVKTYACVRLQFWNNTLLYVIWWYSHANVLHCFVVYSYLTTFNIFLVDLHLAVGYVRAYGAKHSRFESMLRQECDKLCLPILS